MFIVRGKDFYYYLASLPTLIDIIYERPIKKFKSEGLYSRKIGTELRNKILAHGSSEDPKMLFKNFMGREIDSSALLKRSGLL